MFPPVNAQAQKIINQLKLEPLPQEGGFFRQTWLSPVMTAEGRSLGSAILFLITETDFSAMHRLHTDELWHHCGGDPVSLLQLDETHHRASVTLLGGAVLAGQTPQTVVKGGVWQGAKLATTGNPGSNGWALLGCTLAPAWDEREFELGRRDSLIRVFPDQWELVTALTR